MTIERYRLTLVHEYIDENEEVHKIEDPICTDYSIMMDEFAPPRSVIVNEMIERLKHFMLNSIWQEGGNMKFRDCKECIYCKKYYGNKNKHGERTVSNYWCAKKNGFIRSFPKKCQKKEKGDYK